MMRNKEILILLAVLSLLPYSCTIVHEKDYVFNGDEMLELSESQLIFSSSGGVKSVLVGSECYTLAGVPDWIDVQEYDGYFIISVQKNDARESMAADIEVFSGEDAGVEPALLKVIQYGNEYVNLSLSETSNCYLVNSGGNRYRFNASVKGCGNAVGDGSGLAEYIAEYGLEIKDASFARLVWETVPDGDMTSSYDVIEGRPVFCDGEIYFETGSAPGNALIAVCDAGGNILWSWHIWSVNDVPGTSSYNGYEWLDRNLGALNNIPGDMGNKGMLYQWGRKDPFVPTSSMYGGESNNINNSIGDGYLSPDLLSFRGYPYTSAPGNIPYSILHPTTFVNFAGYVSKDWYVSSGDVSNNSYLWGNQESESYEKSVFDPCPSGYVVAPVEAYNVYESIMTGWEPLSDYGRVWSGGNGDFFPLQGYAAGSSGESPMFGVGVVAGYWTSTPVDGMAASYFISLSTKDSYRSMGYRMTGFAVRCVKYK